MKQIRFVQALLLIIILALTFLIYELLVQNRMYTHARQATEVPQIGDRAFLCKGKLINGDIIDLSKESSFILVFFNTNCNGCKIDIPLIEEFRKKINTKVFGVSDDPVEYIKDFMKSTEVNIPVILDDQRILQKKYKVQWNTLVVYVTGGKIAYYQQFHQSTKMLIEELSKILLNF
jgi:peroxiredoxin